MRLASIAATLTAALPALAATDISKTWDDYPAFMRAPASGPHAIIHKKGSGDGKVTLTVYFHGWLNCVGNVAKGGGCSKRGARPEKGLVGVYDKAGVPGDSIFAMLEGPFVEEKTLAPPGLAPVPSFMRGKTGPVPTTPDFFKDLVEKILQEAGYGGLDDLDSIILAGHSGAGGIMAAALAFGGINERIRSVILLDATYIDLSAQIKKWRADRGSSRADVHVVYRPGDSAKGFQGIASLATSCVQHAETAHDSYPDAYLAPLIKLSLGAPKVTCNAAPKASKPTQARPAPASKAKATAKKPGR